MYTLCINTASHDGFMALCDEKSVINYVPCPLKLAEKEVVEFCDTACKGVTTLSELAKVLVVTGPGGFTSLRVGVSIANTIAATTNAVAAGMHLSELYKARLTKKDVVWIHSTKKEAVFVQGFGLHAATWPKPTYVEIKDLLQTLPVNSYICGDSIEGHTEALRILDFQDALLQPVQQVLPAIIVSTEFSKAIIEPWYGRGW